MDENEKEEINKVLRWTKGDNNDRHTFTYIT